MLFMTLAPSKITKTAYNYNFRMQFFAKTYPVLNCDKCADDSATET